jgi:hypothetical protein
MAAARHLENLPDHHGPARRSRHLRLVEPVTAPRRSARQAGVYRRRRLVAGVAVSIVLVVGARTLSPSSSGAPAIPVRAATPQVHVVQPGDSYWSIASSLDRPGDVRQVVDAISTANGGRALQVGDRVSVPG